MGKPKDKGRVGRPTKFSDDMIVRALHLIERGRSDEQTAAILGVAYSTFKKWKAENPHFSAMVNEAKAMVDDAVEGALLKAAVGYTLPALKVVFDFDTGKFHEHEYEKVIGPSEGAAKVWLMNRRRHAWRYDDKQLPQDVPISMAYDPSRRIEKKVVPVINAPALPATEGTNGQESTGGGESGERG